MQFSVCGCGLQQTEHTWCKGRGAGVLLVGRNALSLDVSTAHTASVLTGRGLGHTFKHLVFSLYHSLSRRVSVCVVP